MCCVPKKRSGVGVSSGEMAETPVKFHYANLSL